MRNWIVVLVFGLIFPSMLYSSGIGGEKVRDPNIIQATVGIFLGQGSSICTGFYIGNNKVVTAAHCIDPENPIRDLRFNLYSGIHSCQVVKKKSAPAHKNSDYFWEDVAVLTVDCGDLDMSEVPAFELAPASQPLPDVFKIAGYGLDSVWFGRWGGPPPTFPELNQTPMDEPFDFGRIFDSPDLTQESKAYFKRFQAEADQGKLRCFAASPDKTNLFGDSGGPAYFYNERGRPVVVGIFTVVIHHTREGDKIYQVISNCVTMTGRFRDWILFEK